MSEERVIAELRKQVYRGVLELHEGDKATAELWLSSPIRALGDHAPVALMGTEVGVLKVRNLIRKWEEGAVS